MIAAGVERALDSLSSNGWARLVMKWYLLGYDLVSEQHAPDSALSNMRRQIEMSSVTFTLVAALVFGVAGSLAWMAVVWEPYAWMILSVAGGLIANVVMAVRNARRAIRKTLIGSEEDLLALGQYVSQYRNLSGECGRVLRYLEARHVGESVRQPALRAWVFFAYRMIYASYELSGRPLAATQPQNHFNKQQDNDDAQNRSDLPDCG